MNKEKLKHLPFNLIFSLGSLVGYYVFLSMLCKIPETGSGFLAFMFYLRDAVSGANEDYFEEKIKNLEEKTKNL